MERIAVVGTGYVGLVLGACLADHGHRVTCVDVDVRKVEALRNGELPIYEDGLEDIVMRAAGAGRLTFTSNAGPAIRAARLIFIAVGTPEDRDGSADLSYVLSVAKTIGREMDGPKVVICKSTVPVGTCRKVARVLERYAQHPFHVVSNPEFLREGSAIEDFKCPDRVVIGADDDEAGGLVASVYEGIVEPDRIVRMSVQSAEMTKYAANSLLATKISFINEIANICERVGADVEEVRRGISLDHRIGPHFLRSGVGYGGSCFPKDVRALARVCDECGFEARILRAVDEVNSAQKLRLVEIASGLFPSMRDHRFAIWGLAFKPDTDDVRESPALEAIRELVRRGAQVAATDPVAIPNSERALFDLDGKVRFFEDPYEALEGADALFVFTEWECFVNADLDQVRRRLRNPVVLDGRNIFDVDAMAAAQLLYVAIGRASSSSSQTTFARTA